MNAVNRVIVIVELVIVLALMPISIVALLFFRSNLVDTTGGLMGGANAAFTQTICIGGAAVLFVVAILLLFLELQRGPSHHLRVTQVTDGDVEVTPDAMILRLEQAVMQIADVVRVKPRIAAVGRGNAVDVVVELETGLDVNVPKKTQEVIAVVKQVMEEQMGLHVGKIQVHLDHSRVNKKQQST